ncbi:hypothetical protein BLNAU_10499 [Blattamonas nauphoetae]|uniref:Uncharacterized protein n=1 Tax=Blattamonas nauphoetae TaxID=2049346 RepID=A0ABQ9XRU4_9EUKA|nr:hypothetical protein BLNAU_10499 [Blattamonas nauphoetae]
MCDQSCCYNFWAVTSANLSQEKGYSMTRRNGKIAIRIYRLICLFFLLFHTITALINSDFPLTYYTIQSFSAAILYFVFIQFYRRDPSKGSVPSSQNTESSTPFDKMTYITSLIAVTNGLIATLAFWILLYSPGILTIFNTIWFQAVHHGLGFVLAAVDVVFFSRITYRWSHFVYPTFFALGYWAFSAVRFAFTKTWIYPFLDFTRIDSAIGVPLILAFCIGFPMLWALATWGRNKVIATHSSSVKGGSAETKMISVAEAESGVSDQTPINPNPLQPVNSSE